MGGILLRGKVPAFELGLERTFAVVKSVRTTVGSGGREWVVGGDAAGDGVRGGTSICTGTAAGIDCNLPGSKLVMFFHVVHDLLQRLLLLDIHLIA